MSFDSRTIIDEGNNIDNNSNVTYNRRDTYFGSTVSYTSSMFVNIRQLQTDLHAQHQHEKDVLTGLNQRFHLFVDRVQRLQSENSKYLAAISDLRRQQSGISSIDVQWDEHYLGIKSNLLTVRNANVDYESDFELFQLQIAIYQQLIEFEQQRKDKRILILEEELKKLVSVLVTLRTSYAELQREVEYLYAEGDDLLKQYLTLTYDWCNIKKQQKKLDLSVKTLKSYIVFYKNLHSYIGQDFVSVQSNDDTQFWALELDKIVKRIRHDFEAYYATINREMTAYYQRKMEEIETDVKQALHYQQIEIEEFAMIYQAQQMEYEKVQKSLSYEKETLIKLETTYSKLEAEFNSIQLQYEERFEAQSTELHSVQESIFLMSYDVDEIRRSKAHLEAEIIVYRHLLDINETEERVAIVPRIQSVGNEMMGKFVVKRQRRGSIGIKECVPNGAYISLVNHSTNKDIDISRWVLTRRIDSPAKIRYTIPDGVRLERGSELKIYARSGGGGTAELSSHQKLVNKDLVSWGTGNTIETRLFNQNDDEEASYSQSIAFKRDNETAARELRHAKRVLAITGAGISADSGLPTYRGIGALSGYTMHTRPDICWKYIYQIESACRAAKHNAAHEALVALESKFEQFTVLTQNVDGLHRNAGTKNLIEIHGNIQDLFCTSCGYEKHVTNFESMKIPPDCERCGALVRPRVVLFGEMLPMRALMQLYEITGQGLDAVISIGTTSVFPYIAEPVLLAARNNAITIEINPGDTEVSSIMRYRLRDRAIVILPELLKHLS